ncbi:MAG TPA: hypothetical protein DCW90_13495 [Lachnospiraceae bacterium]|nr:pro-sigmaK processing inhibitor BofA family protein [uncultured Lachnoclostridium sp.]HAU86463.1 hypothetical protein [Lachnospiraceae bacterium]
MNLLIYFLPILAGVVLLVSILANKMEWFLNFATRLCVGGLALCITSAVMVRFSIPGSIGVNSATLGTIGLLGIPGYILVISIEVLKAIK